MIALWFYELKYDIEDPPIQMDQGKHLGNINHQLSAYYLATSLEFNELSTQLLSWLKHYFDSLNIDAKNYFMMTDILPDIFVDVWNHTHTIFPPRDMLIGYLEMYLLDFDFGGPNAAMVNIYQTRYIPYRSLIEQIPGLTATLFQRMIRDLSTTLSVVPAPAEKQRQNRAPVGKLWKLWKIRPIRRL